MGEAGCNPADDLYTRLGVRPFINARGTWTYLSGSLERPIGMYLYGRKMYETMAIWETPDVIPGRTPAMLEFARIWQAADKIVYSKSRSRGSVERPKRMRPQSRTPNCSGPRHPDGFGVPLEFADHSQDLARRFEPDVVQS